MNEPYNPSDFNVGHSIFPGFNDYGGVVICGYEWGYSAKDEALEQDPERYAVAKERLASIQTFNSKGWDSPYDRRIHKWFSMFGHPLGEEEGYSDFDKCILQTNWCDDMGNQVSDYEKFLSDGNRANFLGIMREFRPSLLLFMGIKQIEYIQDSQIKPVMEALFGPETVPLRFERKEAFEGKKFRLAFQEFDNLSVIALPHPSGSMGLSDAYIQLYASEIGDQIAEFKRARNRSRVQPSGSS